MKRISAILTWIKLHKKISIGIGIIILVLAFFLRPKPSKPIDTTLVKYDTITNSVTATGTIDADKTVNLNFLTAGKLTYVGVKKGDSVTAGEVIATLDQRSAEKSLESSLRDYSKQRNTFDQTKDNNGNVENPINAPTTALKRILQNNQYDLDKAVLSVEMQDLAKENSVLTTPISGVVTRADETIPGKNISLTDTYTISDLSTLEFKVDVDEADIGKVVLDQPVKITLDAFPDATITLPVTDIDFTSHATSTGGNAYTVTVALGAAAAENYRIGMTGDAEIITAERHHVLVIPSSAVTDGNMVYVQKGKKFEKRKVVLGLQNDTQAEVLSGLSENENVATQTGDVKSADILKTPIASQ